jgi:fused signal recognition particle receptor
MIRGEEGSDPASVIFNTISHARTIGADVVLADTAGRLHTKTELMDEIRKVKKAASKARDNAPDEVWLVVDGTTGQNALMQAKEFHDVLALSGIVLTKLDGTAKGGVVIAIADALNIPVRYVGVGETVDDLKPFVPKAFVAALFEETPDIG